MSEKRLFTPEFCALLDELKELDKQVSRIVEDAIDALIQNKQLSEASIFNKNTQTIQRKKEIRAILKRMYDKYLEDRGESNGN